MEGTRQEKIYTLKLAREVERRLRAAGFDVVQVRDRDEFVPLEEQPARPTRRKADLCWRFTLMHRLLDPEALKGRSRTR